MREKHHNIKAEQNKIENLYDYKEALENILISLIMLTTLFENFVSYEYQNVIRKIGCQPLHRLFDHLNATLLKQDQL